MFGVDDLLIAGLVAAVAGAAMQYRGQYMAQKAAQNRMAQAQTALGSAQDKINQKILEAAKGYDTKQREGTQADEAQRVANDIKQDVSASQAIRDQQTETQGNVSGDYTAGRATSQAKTQAKANAFADLIGQIRSAGNLRRLEGYRLNRFGEDIDQLARNARGNFTVAQSEAQRLAQGHQGLQNFGKLLSTAGSLMTMGAGVAGAAAPAAGSALSSGLSASAAGGASGLTAGGATLGGAASNAFGTGLRAGGASLLGSGAGSSSMGMLPYLQAGGYLSFNPWKGA